MMTGHQDLLIELLSSPHIETREIDRPCGTKGCTKQATFELCRSFPERVKYCCHDHVADVFNMGDVVYRIKPPENKPEKPVSGMLPEEEAIMDSINKAWEGFLKLTPTHPSDKPEFHRAIHTLQHVLAIRVLRRIHPGYYLSYDQKGSVYGTAETAVEDSLI